MQKVTDLRERLAEEHTALEAAKQKTEEDDDLMVMASVVIDYLYDENEELEEALEEAEDDLEEAEEDVEEIQGIAEDAVKNTAGYDALIKHILDLLSEQIKGRYS